jgi:sugar phosphate permease
LSELLRDFGVADPGQKASVPPSDLLLAVGLLAVHKIFEGGSGPPRRALQNELIPSGTPERATILSFGEGLGKIVIVFLVWFAIGKDAEVIRHWWIPAAATIVTTICLYVYLRRNPPRDAEEKKAETR